MTGNDFILFFSLLKLVFYFLFFIYSVVECGSQSLSQIRLLSPMANNLCLLLQVRSRLCTDNNLQCNLNIVGFYTSNHLHMDFTVLR